LKNNTLEKIKKNMIKKKKKAKKKKLTMNEKKKLKMKVVGGDRTTPNLDSYHHHNQLVQRSTCR
jgi:hypothetical protein